MFGRLGGAGGRLKLLKLPFLLGSVAVAGVLGLSAVPEKVYSSQLTKWARKVRGDASESLHKALDHAKVAGQVAGRHTVAGAKAGAKWTGARATEIGNKGKAKWSARSFFRKKHVVRAGDSLKSLASQHRTTVQELKRKNGLKKESIAVGTTIFL